MRSVTRGPTAKERGEQPRALGGLVSRLLGLRPGGTLEKLLRESARGGSSLLGLWHAQAPACSELNLPLPAAHPSFAGPLRHWARYSRHP